jgi:hypothetical protein
MKAILVNELKKKRSWIDVNYYMTLSINQLEYLIKIS